MNPNGFFFITNRSTTVGCCMVVADPDNTANFSLEYLSTIPSSIGSGVEQTLLWLALKFCHTQWKSQGGTKGQIILKLSEDYIREHQETVFVPIMTNQFGFTIE